jgi:hypothetical protein
MVAATAIPGLAVLWACFDPFVAALRLYGTASAPDDLLRYGAELSSLALKPHFLGGGAASAINAEAHLYPGAGLTCLALASVGVAGASLRSTTGWLRFALIAGVIGLAAGGAFVLVAPPAVAPAVQMATVAVVWLAPIALAIWAIGSTTSAEAPAPAVAIRLGIAGAALAFVLSLGPEVRHNGQAFGPAPYFVLTQISTAFEGTRVPARFGGIMLLFLAMCATGVLGAFFRSQQWWLRISGGLVGVAALLACASELPLPPSPQGHALVTVGRLRDRAYGWLAERPGRLGVLELPDWPPEAKVDYRLREWRSLRHMLAAKQHHQHLANGTGRIEPLLWRRFRGLEPWSEPFFRHITSYFPVDYVLVHEGGIAPEARESVWSKVAEEGWREEFRSRIRIYSVDRSKGKGAMVDRLYLRERIAPAATVQFAARLAGEPGAPTGDVTSSAVLELLRDSEVVAECPVAATWHSCAAQIIVAKRSPLPETQWPRTTTLLRWQIRGNAAALFEMKDLTVTPAGEPQP